MAYIITKILYNKGTELYKNHFGVTISPTGSLILFVILGLLIAWVSYARHKEEKLEKDLIDKYGKK